MQRASTYFLLLLLITGAFACRKAPEVEGMGSQQTPYQQIIPPGFPPMEIPEDNQLTLERVALGKKMFYDPIMSLDSTISCGSCHHQEIAFADYGATSIGVNGGVGTRNTIGLANVGYQENLLREGGVPTLEMQVLVPIQEEHEFATNILTIADLMNTRSDYMEMSRKAYGRDPDAYVITRAIAAFERTMISGMSDYDLHFSWNKNVLDDAALHGYELFNSDELACSTCHGTFLFTDQTFRNNGLYLEYEDEGLKRLTGLDSDHGKFKVASLRNVALTAPYMHDGSVATLEEVIDHYASGGFDHPNKDSLISGFEITEEEKADLIAFLESLTDPVFISDPNLQP